MSESPEGKLRYVLQLVDQRIGDYVDSIKNLKTLKPFK